MTSAWGGRRRASPRPTVTVYVPPSHAAPYPPRSGRPRDPAIGGEQGGRQALCRDQERRRSPPVGPVAAPAEAPR